MREVRYPIAEARGLQAISAAVPESGFCFLDPYHGPTDNGPGPDVPGLR